MSDNNKLPQTRLIVALVAICTLLIASTVNTYKIYNQNPAVIEDDLKSTKAQDNVFRIFIVTDGGGVGGGTGYLIKTEAQGVVVLTNKHICDGDPSEGIFILDQDGQQYMAKVRRKAKLTDLCLLETPDTFLNKYAGLTLAPPDTKLVTGQLLYVYGHPGLRKLTGSNGPFVNETWAPLFEEEHLDAKQLKIGRADIVIYPGSSGSPVLNEEGLVVGTIFAYEGRTNIALFIPLREIVEFLAGGM